MRWARSLVDHQVRKKVAPNLDGLALGFSPTLTPAYVWSSSNCVTKLNQSMVYPSCLYLAFHLKKVQMEIEALFVVYIILKEFKSYSSFTIVTSAFYISD